MKIIAQNKKAFYDYTISEEIEAGVVLSGDEVKSLRAGGASLIGSFAHIKDAELFLLNAHIAFYDKAYTKSDEQLTRRTRKLLVHKRQLMRLIGMTSQKGITIIPLKIYFNTRNIAKIQLGIAVHKKSPERKKELQERDIKRQTRRELKEGG